MASSLDVDMTDAGAHSALHHVRWDPPDVETARTQWRSRRPNQLPEPWYSTLVNMGYTDIELLTVAGDGRCANASLAKSLRLGGFNHHSFNPMNSTADGLRFSIWEEVTSWSLPDY